MPPFFQPSFVFEPCGDFGPLPPFFFGGGGNMALRSWLFMPSPTIARAIKGCSLGSSRFSQDVRKASANGDLSPLPHGVRPLPCPESAWLHRGSDRSRLLVACASLWDVCPGADDPVISRDRSRYKYGGRSWALMPKRRHEKGSRSRHPLNACAIPRTLELFCRAATAPQRSRWLGARLRLHKELADRNRQRFRNTIQQIDSWVFLLSFQAS